MRNISYINVVQRRKASYDEYRFGFPAVKYLGLGVGAGRGGNSPGDSEEDAGGREERVAQYAPFHFNGFVTRNIIQDAKTAGAEKGGSDEWGVCRLN